MNEANEKTMRINTTMLAAAVLLASLLVVVTMREAQATFSGEDGRIAFASNRTTGEGVANPEGDFEIFTMKPDGSDVRQLTENAAFDFDPEWSPDGRKIAFVSDKAFAPGIYKMNADGTKQKKVSRSSGTVFESPGWSPGGDSVAFTSNQDGGDDIYAMNASGSRLQRLTVNGIPRDARPVYSPDGSEIAFESDQEGNFDIYTMHPDGTGAQNLTNDPAGDFTPDWRPVR